MERKLEFYTSLLLVLALVFSLAVIVEERYIASRERDLYPKGITVVDLDGEKDLVTATDCNGYLWGFYGCEDLAEGDILAVIMDSRGTMEIYDDVMVKYRYAY